MNFLAPYLVSKFSFSETLRMAHPSNSNSQVGSWTTGPQSRIRKSGNQQYPMAAEILMTNSCPFHQAPGILPLLRKTGGIRSLSSLTGLFLSSKIIHGS